MKPLVIYHANCTDGFGAAFAAWLKLGDNAEYLPMDYGKVKTPENFDMKVSLAAKGNTIYILDFSFPRPVMEALFAHSARVVWLDHHKTAFEMWCGSWAPKMKFSKTDDCYIELDDERSGALLAWEYFHPGIEVPELIQHIDDRDRWQFKMEGSRELHAVLASLKPWTFKQWDHILEETSRRANDGTGIDSFYDDGTVLLRAHNQHVQAVLKQAKTCVIHEATTYEGYESGPCGDISVYSDAPKGLAANAPAFLASDLGQELANRSGTFGLVWSMAGDGQIHCSLRSNGDYDVSAIAKAFGGGGHRYAAGFSTDINTLLSWLK